MKTRLIHIDLDYPAIQSWYFERGLPKLDAVFFSPYSVVVEDDHGRLLCAVINYRDRYCPAGSISWAVGNPWIPKRMLSEAFMAAFEYSLRQLKASGCKIVVSRLVNRSFSKMLKKLGGTSANQMMEEILWF